MTEPRTEAGKRLVGSLRKLLPSMPLTWEGIDDRIAAIEAEAGAALRSGPDEGLRGAAEGAEFALSLAADAASDDRSWWPEVCAARDCLRAALAAKEPTDE